MDRIQYQTVILAALLHDIGKLLGRGSGAKREAGRHPEISAKFVTRFGAHFASVADADLLRTLVQRHHEDRRMGDTYIVQGADPAIRPLALLVSRADNYSSMERGEEAATRDYRAVPLASAFARLQIHSDRPLPAPRQYGLAPLAPSAAFPEEFDSIPPEQMNDHLEAFGAEAQAVLDHVDRQSFDSVIRALMTLLHRYCWCVPSNTQEEQPDVSLYDHLRVTSAIAAGLYQFHGDTPSENSLRSDDEEKLILLAGDISGIQRYIFDITNIGVGGAAKRLRARSFFISLLTEVVARRVLKLFDLPPANILMASGGKFYALLPKLPDAAQRIARLRRDLDDWSHTEMKASLAINTAWVPIAGTDFQAFDRPLATLMSRLADEKRRPLRSILVEEGRWREDAFVFGDLHLHGEEAICKGCGAFPGEPVGEEDTILCSHCQQDVRVGRALPTAHFVAFYDTPSAGSFRIMDVSFDLVRDASAIHVAPAMVLALDTQPDPAIFRFPVLLRHLARHVPVATQEDCTQDREPHRRDDALRPGMPLTFEDIAQRSRGRPLLGWLKADVDNLGRLFTHGLSHEAPQVRSVSRFATLSRMLDLFFSGWVQERIHRQYPDIYVVYSGGDDLLLLGPWDRVLEFSRDLHHTFSEFTNVNPNITLSAGVAFGKPRGPVLRAAESADHVLDLSKDKPALGSAAGRDQLTAFGHTAKWQDVDTMMAEARRLANWLSNGPMSASFVRDLLVYGKMNEDFERTGEAIFLRFLPLMTYDIARNLPPPDDRDPTRRDVRLWAERAKDRAGPLLKHMVFLASYALTACRGGS